MTHCHHEAKVFIQLNLLNSIEQQGLIIELSIGFANQVDKSVLDNCAV